MARGPMVSKAVGPLWAVLSKREGYRPRASEIFFHVSCVFGRGDCRYFVHVTSRPGARLTAYTMGFLNTSIHTSGLSMLASSLATSVA